MIKEIEKITKALLIDLKKSTLAVIKQKGLKSSSALYNSVEWIDKKDVITLFANDYFQEVSQGRRRGAALIPAQDLIPWMKKNGITPRGNMSYNSLAFIIANSIKKNGIKGKLYLSPVIDVATDITAEVLAEGISVAIVNELVESLESI